MAKEVSNKTLIVLMAIAVIISFGGTYISLSRLNAFILPAISGASITTPGTGYANYSIVEETSIAVSKHIDFGDGYSNTSYSEMEGNASDHKCTGGNGTWDWSARGLQYILVTNDGNVNVTINVSTNVSDVGFIGTTAGTISAVHNASIVAEEISGTDTACFGSTEIKKYTNISEVKNLTLCNNLSFFDAWDTINVSARLIVPEDVPKTAKSCELTFYAKKNAIN